MHAVEIYPCTQVTRHPKKFFELLSHLLSLDDGMPKLTATEAGEMLSWRKNLKCH